MFELEWCPATPQELTRQVVDNFRGDRHVLTPVGGRTALHYGGSVPLNSVAVSLAELNRVVDYPARDMTITVEAGLRWETLQQELARQGQRLPMDVPQAHRATVGGAVATNTSGPGRFGHGTFRDYVIGVSAIDGTGRLFSAGGRVVKNVAGYDFCKLLTGSLGTLGIITRLTFKLRPLAEQTRLLWLTFTSTTSISGALDKLNLSSTRPVVVDVLNEKGARQLCREAKHPLPHAAWNACLGFEGSAREVEWQIGQLLSEVKPFSPGHVEQLSAEGSAAVGSALIEYQSSSDDPLTFQATLPASRVLEFLELASTQEVALQAHAGNGIVIGHLPDRVMNAAQARNLLAPLRRFAESHSGALSILCCEDSWKKEIDVFGTRPGSWTWMQQLKSQLDPQNLLNRGRLPN